MSDEAIFQAETNSVQRLLSRRCKNVEDCRVSAMHFLAMTMPTLALATVLAMGIADESWADESTTTPENSTTTTENSTTPAETTTPTEAPKLLPNTGSCGAGCSYEITTDTTGARNLRVYNDPNYTGNTKVINSSAFRGNGYIGNTYYDNNYSNAVFDKIIIDGDFETIGGSAFKNTSANEVVFNGNIGSINYGAFEGNNLTSITLPQGLKTIEGEAFYHNKIYSITIPDSVTSIGSYAFSPNGGGVSTVDIADTLDSLGTAWPFGINSNLSIICKGDVEKCQSLVKEYNLGNIKIVDLSDNVTGVDKEHCTGEKYFWNGTSCSRKEAYCDNNMYYNGIGCIMRPTDGSDIVCEYDLTGYLKIGDKCYSPAVTYAKKHYTPTEANQWLKDTDNTIILTFKINR